MTWTLRTPVALLIFNRPEATRRVVDEIVRTRPPKILVSGASQTWDHQWQFACWSQHGLSIVPATNLVSNLGFGPGAQHYVEIDPRLADLPAGEMLFPLRHPSAVVRSRAVDDFVFGLHRPRD